MLDDCDAEVTAFMVPRTERDRRRMFHVERGTLAPWENVVRSTVFQHGDYPYIYIFYPYSYLVRVIIIIIHTAIIC